MGLTVCLAIDSGRFPIAEAFVAAAARLSNAGRPAEAKICGVGYGWKKLPHVEIGSPEFVALAARVVDSDDRLSVDVCYESLSGQIIWPRCYLAGSRYLEGTEYVAEIGQIECVFGYKELARTARQTSGWINVATRAQPTRWDEKNKIEEAKQRYKQECLNIAVDAEQLLIDACGLDDRSELRIEHAAIHREYGWFTPIGCSAIYHRDYREFARDIARIYAFYHHRTPVSRTNTPPDDNHWLVSAANAAVPTDREYRLPFNYEPYRAREVEELGAFQAGLTFEQASTAASGTFTAAQTREMVEYLCIGNSKIHFRNCGDLGCIVSMDPYYALWEFYRDLARAMFPESGQW